MTRKSKVPRSEAAKEALKRAGPLPQSEPPPADETDEIEEGPGRIVARPDGYYWQALDGQQEIGPFETLADAEADMESGDDANWVPGETLAEAEREIGIADWIDPETGQPAEGQAPPHLDLE